jgi:hypothetical protein
MQNDEATRDLLEVKKVMDDMKIPFFLAYGTCLGAVRNKDFISYDDDIDLGVVEKISYKQRKDLGWMLFDLGFRLQPDITFNVYGRFEFPETGYNGDKETGIIVCQRNVPISILFFKEENEEDMICIPKMGSIPVMSSPKKFYKKLAPIKFKGETFLTPSPVEGYLDYTYKNWRIPDKEDKAPQYSETHDPLEVRKKYL